MSEVLRVGAPVSGRSIPLSEVPDPVFAEQMVGPGRAIDPERGELTAVAPIDGQIVKLHPHAYVIVADGGRGVLVHLGIDTVQLKGVGFRLLAEEGQSVQVGTPIVVWDSAAVQAGGRSPVCPVIALDAAPEAVVDVGASVDIRTGDELFRWE